MKALNFYDRFELDLSQLGSTKFNPYYVAIESGLSETIRINGNDYINLAANNYLGLADNDEVKSAMKDAIDKYGASMCGTPIATGAIDIYQQLEKKLASFIGVEDLIILPSCYQANNGLFSAICRKEDTIIIDHFAHSSLIEGVKATGLKIRPFVHNNMKSLEKNLVKSQGAGSIFVVTESVFSTEGSVAPFEEIVELCKKYNAIPVIDDSHGIGVLGDQGSGILNYKRVEKFEGIYTTSLGKAIANVGGVIGGKKELIDYLRYYCSHLVYSTAITPASIAGVTKVIEILEREGDKILKKMWQYKNRISNKLKELGFEVVEGEAPITSILGGSNENTFRITKELFDKGILATPFVYPSVPPEKGVVRLIAGANVPELVFEKVLSSFEEIKQ